MEDRPLLWDEEADLEEKQESQRSVCTESPAISGVLLGEGFIRPIIASPHRSAVASGHVRGGTWRRNNAAESAEKKILNGDAIGKLKIDMEEERSESSFESFNYDEHHSLVRQIWLRNRSEREIRNEAISRWILTFLVAITMAFIAIGVRWSSVQIAAFKFSFVQEMINSQKWISAGFFFVGFNILLVTAASILISFVEPVAAGSGIPEIKCTLNGIKIPRIVRFKTLLVKSLGMIGTVSASMPVGMEGPMIHAGAICGAGISQGKSTTMKWSCITKKPFRPFRNDREKRDFISCGAAAGVACAFGAPIGGVLFSLEEGSSFWNLSLTWRTFFCAMSCAFLYNVLWIRLQTAGDRLGESNMFVFGDVIGLQSSAQYSFFEVIFFIAMGVMGGAFGALYNYLNEKLTLWRFRNLKRSWMRVAEASIVCLFISTVSFILPFLIGSCIQDGDLTKKAENMTVKFNCPTSFHNDLATLMFNQADLSIKSLLHSQHQSFSFLSLSIFFVVFFLFSCWTYGISIPGGLFVPNLLAGAAFGRLVGQGLEICMHPVQPVSAETYALIGAAAMLGGMARMTISLTVILIEATGDLRHGLPIMVTLLTSKWIGDFFNHGLYDIHIKLKRLPFLEWFSPQIANFLLAMDIMNTQVVVCFSNLYVYDVFVPIFTDFLSIFLVLS